MPFTLATVVPQIGGTANTPGAEPELSALLQHAFLDTPIGGGYPGTVGVRSEPAMNHEPIQYHKKAYVGYITLNRPEAGNAIDVDMAMALQEACQRINRDSEVRVVVVSGTGEKAFCSGEDIGPISNSASCAPPSLDSVKQFTLRYNVAETVSAIECPLVAAINGDASGAGLALALACDLRIASAQASFGVGDQAHGCLLANGLTQLLPRIVGRGKAMELLLTTEPIQASEALNIGLVHRVVPHQDVLSEAVKMAEDMASKAPIALRYAKEAVNKGMDLTLEQALRLECDLYMMLHTTHDRTEGINAFRGKRKPSFQGE
jgi:enoyl-CoA hydratase/carnithine racemase